MKKLLILALVLAAGPGPALAGTITVGTQSRATTAAQDAAMATRRTQHNATKCTDKGLAATCTQAQLNAVTGCAAGACGTIYPITNAGTADYFLDEYALKAVLEVEAQTVVIARGDAVNAWNVNRDAPATNAQCTSASLPNGCTKGQVACVHLSGSSTCQ